MDFSKEDKDIVQLFTAVIVLNIIIIEGIIACVAVLPVDLVRCVSGCLRPTVLVLLADNI
jgi:hypothetical protein